MRERERRARERQGGRRRGRMEREVGKGKTEQSQIYKYTPHKKHTEITFTTQQYTSDTTTNCIQYNNTHISEHR